MAVLQPLHRQCHVLVLSVHGSTERPDSLDSIPALAAAYGDLLDDLDLKNVTVVGNSIGGRIAAELALLDSDRISGLVLVDAAGIEVDGHPVADIFPLSLDELMKLSYHNPEPFRVDPATVSDEQRAVIAANREALRVYGGSMTDPSLRARLGAISIPTLVVWGDSDGVVDPVYGRAYADAIPGARFELLAGAGHVPQIESLDKLLPIVWDFAVASTG